MIQFECDDCGKTLQVADEHAGKTVGCPCGARMMAPVSAAVGIEDGIGSRQRGEESDAYQESYQPPAGSDASVGEALGEINQHQQYEQPQEVEGKSGSVITGVLMMVGAIIWFVVGWAGGVIFFYPPILFIFGLITFFKGLASR